MEKCLMINNVKIITISGVDGAGKTTVLREFTEILRQKYKVEVKELRHRPSILPILSSIKYGKTAAENKTVERLPRTGGNKSKVSSLLRFFYYLMDYTIGQWIIYFKYTRKGILIIYDRYYFDFINDGRRTNLNLSRKFVQRFYKLVFKPEINIFLYASPEVILKRKQEMDANSITNLTNKYNSLFKTYSIKDREIYECIENIDLSETLSKVEELYISYK